METINLIQAVPVVRDEYGMFWHPDLPGFEEGEEEERKQWLAHQGLEVKTARPEYSEDAIADRYFESHDPDCSYWDPAKPDGDGWFILSICDTDDGLVCWWARRVTP
ncbi:hypothetical protein [Pseudomonas abieticivorans]|uniref:hypothetical protein n=1 Tax=Pseudomonas abieticivorans TaxID=2931382 RepID=UPI003F68FC4F